MGVINTKNKFGEIGYWLSKKFIRQGYMTESVKILEEDFFARFGLNRIEIRCDERNTTSAGVAIKCGYKKEGLLRENIFKKSENKYRNTLIFSKIKSDWTKERF